MSIPPPPGPDEVPTWGSPGPIPERQDLSGSAWGQPPPVWTAPPPGPQDGQPPPPPNLPRGVAVAIIAAVAGVVVVMAITVSLFANRTGNTGGAGSTSPEAEVATSPTTSTTSSATPGPVEVVPDQVPSPYPREVTVLSQAERKYYGDLDKGDCLASRVTQDEPWATVATVPCSEPHVQQVMGFVEVTKDIPDDPVAREMAVVQRCNSLKASHGIPPSLWKGYIYLNVPDTDDVAAGIGVALCWAPFRDTTWTGSLVDGTAVVLGP